MSGTEGAQGRGQLPVRTDVAAVQRAARGGGKPHRQFQQIHRLWVSPGACRPVDCTDLRAASLDLPGWCQVEEKRRALLEGRIDLPGVREVRAAGWCRTWCLTMPAGRSSRLPRSCASSRCRTRPLTCYSYGDDLRCSMRWPDPAQRSRIAEIRDNLLARIKDAEHEGWLGEAEGLKSALLAPRIGSPRSTGAPTPLPNSASPAVIPTD